MRNSKSTLSDNIDNQEIILQLEHKPSKAPTALLDVIRKKNHQLLNPSVDEAQMFIIKKTSRPNHCCICDEDSLIPKSVSIADCDHKDHFCTSCLQHYAIYIIDSQSTIVKCPSEFCKKQMTTNGLFFKGLPGPIQTKYRKIQQSCSLTGQKITKMCQRKGCEGYVKHQDGPIKMRCGQCGSDYCSLCLLPAHKGGCEQSELKQFQKNLRYRQCPRCKRIIDKFEGRNHMTCLCRHQFCYVCGADWTPAHYQNHNQSGEAVGLVLLSQPVVVNGQQQRDQQKNRCSLFYILTFPLRVIAAVFLYCLTIALFGFVMILILLALILRGDSKSRNQNEAQKRKIDDCMDNLCSTYFGLYCKIFKALF